MSDGFLGRWARRKLEVKKEALAKQSLKSAEQDQISEQAVAVQDPNLATVEGDIQPSVPSETILDLPTEADLDAVLQGGEIRGFMNPKVPGELRNKAFKALFSQPQFNQMDFMDVYVDDYSVSKPLTAAMIDMMALGKQLLSRPDLEPKSEQLETTGVYENSALQAHAEAPDDGVLPITRSAGECPELDDAGEPPLPIPSPLQTNDSQPTTE